VSLLDFGHGHLLGADLQLTLSLI